MRQFVGSYLNNQKKFACEYQGGVIRQNREYQCSDQFHVVGLENTEHDFIKDASCFWRSARHMVLHDSAVLLGLYFPVCDGQTGQ